MEPTSTARTTGLCLQVETEDGSRFEGSLVHFTGGTLTAHFWGSDLPSLGLALACQVQLRGLSTDLPPLPASPIGRSELPGGRSYRFGYTLTPEFQARIPKALMGLFPFRASHRVQPTEKDPVIAQVAGAQSNEWHSARVLDLSSGGLGLAVCRDVEAQLHGETSIQIKLEFPGLGSEVRAQVRATVQHRRLNKDQVQYGLKLDSDAGGLGSSTQAIDAYIIDRERQGA